METSDYPVIEPNSNKTGPRALNPALKIQCVRQSLSIKNLRFIWDGESLPRANYVNNRKIVPTLMYFI